MKLGAPADLPDLRQRRLFGLDIELMRRTPGGLPAGSNHHYFSIAKSGQYWSSVMRDLEIAIAGGSDPSLRFSVYVMTRPEGRSREPLSERR